MSQNRNCALFGANERSTFSRSAFPGVVLLAVLLPLDNLALAQQIDITKRVCVGSGCGGFDPPNIPLPGDFGGGTIPGQNIGRTLAAESTYGPPKDIWVPPLSDAKTSNDGEVLANNLKGGLRRPDVSAAQGRGSLAAESRGVTAGNTAPVVTTRPEVTYRPGTAAGDGQVGATANIGGSDPVNPFNGEMILHETDMRLPGVGLDFELIRSYRSRSSATGPLGYSWDHNYNEHLSYDPSTGYSYFDGAGRRISFSKLTDSIQNQDGVCQILRASEDESSDRLESCTMTAPSPHQRVRLLGLGGVVRTFSASVPLRAGSILPLQSIADPNGNIIQVMHEGDRVSRVIDTVGRTIDFSYDDTGYLRAVSVAGSSENAEYEVDGYGDLVRAVPSASARSGASTYIYDRSPRRDAPFPAAYEILQSRSAAQAACDSECAQAQPEGSLACLASCEEQFRQCGNQATAACASGCDVSSCSQRCADGFAAACREAVDRAWANARSDAHEWCDERCTKTCESNCGWSNWNYVNPLCDIAGFVCSFGGLGGAQLWSECFYQQCGALLPGASVSIDSSGKVTPGVFVGASESNSGACTSCCRYGSHCGGAPGTNCVDECQANFGSKPPARAYQQCFESLRSAQWRCSDSSCTACANACNPALLEECDASRQSCKAGCSADWSGTCSKACMQAAEARMQDPGGVRYGHESALTHNLLEIRRVSDGALRIKNTYGEDPHLPSFDAVVRQEYGEGGVVTAHFYDLNNGALPLPGSEDDGAVLNESQFGYVDVAATPGVAERRTLPRDPYNRVHAATVVVDRKGRKSTMYFNEAGLLLRTSMFGGRLTHDIDYHSNGRVRCQAKSKGSVLVHWSCAFYDQDGAPTYLREGPGPAGAAAGERTVQRLFEWRSNPKRLVRVADPRDLRNSLLIQEWDDQGNLVRSTIPGLEDVSYLNDFQGRPGWIIDHAGSVTLMSYDPVTGLLQEMTRDAGGAQPEHVIYSHDSDGYLRQVTRPGYGQTTIAYYSGWPYFITHTFRKGPESTTDDGSQTRGTPRDADGQVFWDMTEQQITSYTYDTEGLVRTIVSQEQCAEDRCPSESERKATCIHRNLAGEEDIRVLPEGNEIRAARQMDASGNETVTITRGPHVRSSSSPEAWDALCKEWRGPFAQEVVQVDVFDPEGRLVRRTDGAGHVTEFGYDWRGRLSRSRNARGLNTWWGFDALGNLAWDVAFSGEGNPLSEGEPAETKNVLELTRYEHDILGRTTSIARLHALHTASGDLARVRDGYARVTTDYESGGSGERKTVVTDDGGQQTTLTYDMLGRLTQELLPTSQSVTHAYPSELLEVIESPASDGPPVKRTIARDGRGLPVREEDSTGKVLWSAEYDSRGLATKLTLESGGSWVYKWDGFGRLVAKTGYDASGLVLSTESREYDLNDNLSAVVDGQGHRTSYEYDALDRLVEETLADGSRYVVEKYVGGSALPEVDTTPGARRTYVYHKDGSLWGLRAESETQTLEQAFARDLLGRPTGAIKQTRDPSGQILPGSTSVVQLAWDTLGNRVSELRSVDGEAPAGGVTRFVTGDGVVERLDLAGTSIVRYFDPLHRVKTAQVSSGHEVTLEYRGLGGESVLWTQVDGREVSRTETIRDGRERIDSITHRFASGAHNQLESPSFKNGWPAGFSRTDATSGQLDVFSQELDPIGRLRNERHARNGLEDYSAYELDRADNWSAMSAVKNIGGRAELAGTPELTATNRLAGGLPGAAQIASDSAGRVTGVDSNRTFSYDPLGRLIHATSGQSTSKFVYDAFGRLSREVTDGVQYDFTPDGDQIVAETRNADPSTTTYFVHGDGLDRPLLRVQGGKAAFYHWGADGSLSFVSDQSGELIEKYSYSAYGERSVEDASGNPIPDSLIGNRYGYRGQMYHAATGLYWMRARWYEPKWGRFLTPDPIGLAGGQNRYMYVNASPTLFWDPFGLDPNSAGDDAPRGEMSALGALMPAHLFGARRGGSSLLEQLDMSRAERVNHFTRRMAGATVAGSAGAFGGSLVAMGGAPLVAGAAEAGWGAAGGPVIAKVFQDRRISGLWDALRLNAPYLTEEFLVPAYEGVTFGMPGTVGLPMNFMVRNAETVAAAGIRAGSRVNMPAWKKVLIDMEEVASGHMIGGSRLAPGNKKDVFPAGMTKSQVERAIRQAYRNGEVLQSQGAERVFVRGPFESGYIEMWVNRATKTIESAWPKL